MEYFLIILVAILFVWVMAILLKLKLARRANATLRETVSIHLKTIEIQATTSSLYDDLCTNQSKLCARLEQRIREVEAANAAWQIAYQNLQQQAKPDDADWWKKES